MLDPKSTERLAEVHPDLARVIYRAAELYDGEFIVTEGARTAERQRMLVAKGASKTMRSRHLPESNKCGMSCAVDLAVKIGGEIRWDWPLYDALAKVVLEAARVEGVPVEWGGAWLSLRDGPHYQLPWSKYP